MSAKRSPPPKSSNPIALRAGLSIGAAAAEDDADYLFRCFEDSGTYGQIKSVTSPKFIIKGRTGSGKSALLCKLEREAKNVIRLDPSHLCLQHISNSTILQFLAANDVRIDPFLEIIWKHTFATELLRRRFEIFSPDASRSVFSRLLDTVQSNRRRSVEYLRDFGLELWPEFEERVSAVTQKVERDIGAELGLDGLNLPLKANANQTITQEEKAEIQRRIQTVLGTQQLSRLQTVIEFMAEEVFTDDRNPYYIIIDDLDRLHVDDEIRLRLLRALIDIVKKFRPIQNVKFCIALRSDLLEEIFEKTRDRGFQEEKYEDNIITLRWTRDQLFHLVESRITEMYRRQYTKENVRFYDVFAQQVQGFQTREYVLERTLMRPRDAILFVNECLDRAGNKINVPSITIREAEGTFSKKRLDSLQYEWISLYPLLSRYFVPLRGKPAHFTPGDFTEDSMQELALSLATTDQSDVDRLGKFALQMVSGHLSFDAWAFEREWLQHLYKVGVVGVKTTGHLTMQWSHKDKQSIASHELALDTRIEVHPMFRNALGVISPSHVPSQVKRRVNKGAHQ